MYVYVCSYSSTCYVFHDDDASRPEIRVYSTHPTYSYFLKTQRPKLKIKIKLLALTLNKTEIMKSDSSQLSVRRVAHLFII